MKFYTIYLSLPPFLEDHIKEYIRSKRIDIYISRSAYVELTYIKELVNSKEEFDLPLDTKALYVYLEEDIYTKFETISKNIHEFLQSTGSYFVYKIDHTGHKNMWNTSQMDFVAQQLIELVDMLNNGQWDGGEINVK